MAGRCMVIVGAGKGLSAALARAGVKAGLSPLLAARDIGKLSSLVAETGARAFACDATDARAVQRLFAVVERDFGAPELVVFNAGSRVRGPLTDLDPDEVEATVKSSAMGGFLVGQAAARLMLPGGKGSIFFTGASASVKGYANSAPFAMGKFALRGLAQSMARELAPKGIHVAHFVIDGGIAGSRPISAEERAGDKWLDPNAIAETYLAIHRQPRSAWTWEIELRPWTENF
jgi:NAD(P)-dependent dehydrogenase (short-subunit alcohol dehydrogenase family)